MPNAIIFDFDGVVVDSEPLHYQAFVMVGKSFNFEFTWEQYLDQYIGFDDRDAFRVMLHQAIEAGHTPDVEDVHRTMDELIAKKHAAFEALAETGTHAILGTCELIEEAHAAGLPIAIASGAVHSEIDQMLRLLKLRDKFEVIVAADDVEHSKPDPTTYAKAFEQLAAACPDAGLTPETTLAIEDTRAGLESAQGAGLQTLGLRTTSPEDCLRSAGRVVDDLSGVTLATLNKWYG
ncbi:MAG: HAD family phosphatase [Planctomycetota bacterium]